LRKRLDSPISPDLKRRIVETLVESIRSDTVECWGVAQSSIVVTYRFTQPSEAAPLVLPRAHSLTSRTKAPETLETLGDHLRRRRLTLKLLQRQVAQQIGVDKTSINNWENNLSKPSLPYMPAILLFPGYNPLPPSKKWSERLVHGRKAIGMTQREAAQRIGVDMGTLAKWERGEREPAGTFADRANHFLAMSDTRQKTTAVRVA
jgi:transcriptional regulator with XRE-family HTH domain